MSQNRAQGRSSLCSILQPYCGSAFWDLEILKPAFVFSYGYILISWTKFRKKFFFYIFSFSFHIHRGDQRKKIWIFLKKKLFSEIPLQNKMYPKTINKNHFQTSLIPRVGPQFSWRMEHMHYFTAELWASPWD